MKLSQNSLKNLEGNRNSSQNFYTKVASKFNWMLRQVRAAKSSLIYIGSPVYYAIQSSSNFKSFSKVRQDKLHDIVVQQYICLTEIEKLETLLLELPKLPLRTQEAIEAKLERRRVRRKEQRHESRVSE